MDRFTAAVVAGVLALVAAAIAAAALVRGREVPPDLTQPAGVTLAYALALQQADADRAWALLASSTRVESDQAAFRRLVAQRGTGAQRARLLVEEESVGPDGTARVVLVRQYPGSDGPFGLFGSTYSQRSPVTLVREGDAWRITVPPDPYLLQPPRKD